MTENEINAPTDSCQNTPSDKPIGRRKTGRAYRREMKRRKYQRRNGIITRGGYDPRVGYLRYDYVDGVWQPTSLVIRYPKHSNCQKWIKNETSARTRHCDHLPSKGNFYRRLFDYWRTMY